MAPRARRSPSASVCPMAPCATISPKPSASLVLPIAWMLRASRARKAGSEGRLVPGDVRLHVGAHLHLRAAAAVHLAEVGKAAAELEVLRARRNRQIVEREFRFYRAA